MKTIRIKGKYRELIVKIYADSGMRITQNSKHIKIEKESFWFFADEVKELKELLKGDKE